MVRPLALALWVALAAGCARLDGLLYLGQTTDRYLLEPNGPTPEETVARERIEPLTLTTADGLTLGAAYVRGSVQPPRGYVLFFHGRTDHLDGHFNRTKRWANLGFDVLVFDYRGFGTSTNVTPSEAGIAQDTQAAHDYLVGRVGPSELARLAYYGHSLGTATSTQQAVKTPPRALVLESGFASVDVAKEDSTRLDLPYGFFALDSWDTEGRLGQVGAPVLLLHGQEDQVMRPEFSQRLFERAHEPKELELVPGAGHDDIPQVLGAAYGERLGAFLDRHLR